MHDAERERVYRFVKEAHELLRHRTMPYLDKTRPMPVGLQRREADGDAELAYSTCLRVLRLMEYAMADTELIGDVPKLS